MGHFCFWVNLNKAESTRLWEQMYHGRDCGNRCIMNETVGTDVSWVTTVPRAAWEIGKDQQSVSIFAG